MGYIFAFTFTALRIFEFPPPARDRGLTALSLAYFIGQPVGAVNA